VTCAERRRSKVGWINIYKRGLREAYTIRPSGQRATTTIPPAKKAIERLAKTRSGHVVTERSRSDVRGSVFVDAVEPPSPYLPAKTGRSAATSRSRQSAQALRRSGECQRARRPELPCYKADRKGLKGCSRGKGNSTVSGLFEPGATAFLKRIRRERR
jgi:hypothetical protein